MNNHRIRSIDIVRGLVMIIMPLDHVRDLIHVDSLTQSPTNLATTTTLLFFTRWITHLCAPVFVFLAGTSVYRVLAKNQNVPFLRRFLITRGLCLIAIEFLVVNTILYFDPGFHTLLFEVIGTIGVGFVLLSFLLNIPVKYLGILALLIIFFNGLFIQIPFNEGSLWQQILSPLFQVSAFPVFANHVLIIAYPIIPWFAIMLLGFSAGRFFDFAPGLRNRTFVCTGILMLLVFLILRFTGLYGESNPWTNQSSFNLSLLSFLNISKYPPSLLFTLVTLGIMLILLAYTDRKKDSQLSKILTVYGKAPLFYFIVHFFIIHVILIIVLLLQGYRWSSLEFSSGTFGRPKSLESGLPLGYIFPIWIGVVWALYKPCKWFAELKHKSNAAWIKYL